MSFSAIGALLTMAGIVPTNCIANMRQSGSFSSGISFLPQMAVCSFASAEDRPAVEGTTAAPSSYSCLYSAPDIATGVRSIRCATGVPIPDKTMEV